MLNRIYLYVVVATYAATSAAQITSCGSLVTYRQYQVLLGSAPECFRSGCGNPSPADSMSSVCSDGSPCFPLWDFLRVKWQDDYCAACHGDLACRISGWPILNATAACETSPKEWLFSSSGTCCFGTQEPFELADWIGQICNASEWRQPFDYYGGMAKEDWEEWVEPWNWTLGLNYTDREDPPSQCASAHDLFTIFVWDNFQALGDAILEIVPVWFLAIYKHDREAAKSRKSALFAGITAGATWIMGNYVTAWLWLRWPGYEDTPLGLLGLLLCSRPSFMALLCIFAIGLSEPLAQWLPYLSEGPGREENHHLADQFLAHWGLRLASAEFFIQASGIAIFWITAIAGNTRGYYHVGTLSPYWRGPEALMMYAGALFHVICSIFSMVLLIASSYAHAENLDFSRAAANRKYIRLFLLEQLDEYYGHVQSDIEKLKKDKNYRSTIPPHEVYLRLKYKENLAKRLKMSDLPNKPSIFQRLGDQARALLRRPPTQTTNVAIDDQLMLPARGNRLRRQRVAQDRPTQGPQDQPDTPAVLRHFLSIYTRVTNAFWSRSIKVMYGPHQNWEVEMGQYQDLRDVALERDRQPHLDTRKAWGKPIVLFSFGFVLLNYMSQWLFWGGFVRSMGPRYASIPPVVAVYGFWTDVYSWCPPDDGKIKGALLGSTAVEVLFTLLFSIDWSSGVSTTIAPAG